MNKETTPKRKRKRRRHVGHARHWHLKG